MHGIVREAHSLSPTECVDEILDQWRRCFNDLMDIEKHYARKEQLLFSRFEPIAIIPLSAACTMSIDGLRLCSTNCQGEDAGCGARAGGP
jgi:hypothetical protein